jgi:hypothetical protein
MLLNLLFVGLVALKVQGESTNAGAAPSCPKLTDPFLQYKIAERLIRLSGYNPDIRPTVSNETFLTKVAVDFYVVNIESFDQNQGLLKLHLIFRQRWPDSRLSYGDALPSECFTNTSTINVPSSMIDSVWTPDLFIINEVEVRKHDLFHRNIYVRLSPDGGILLSQRISLTLTCPELKTGECSAKIESYGLKADELEVNWKETNPIFINEGSPTTTPNFQPTTFKTLAKVEPSRCDSVSSAGSYSCIKARFVFA